MPQNKSIQYDALGLFSQESKSSDIQSGDIGQLNRIQQFNYEVAFDRSLNQSLGSLKQTDSIIRVVPSLSFQYYPTDGRNEKLLGLQVDQDVGAFYHQIVQSKNIYLLVNNFDDEPTAKTLAFGGCLLDQISYSCSYGSPLQCQVGMTGENLVIEDGWTDNQIPTVNQVGIEYQGRFSLPNLYDNFKIRSQGYIGQIKQINSSDLVLKFSDSNFDEQNFVIDQISIDCRLGRGQVSKIGDIIPKHRQLNGSLVTIQLQASVLSNSQERFQDYIGGRQSFDFDVLCQKCCDESDSDFFWNRKFSEPKLAFKFRGARITKKQFSSQIGQKKRVNIEFQIFSQDPFSLSQNFFISGNYGRYSYPVLSWKNSGEISGGFKNGFNKVVYQKIPDGLRFGKFDMSFQGNFDINTGSIFGDRFYTGYSSWIKNISGQIGSGIILYDTVGQFYQSSYPDKTLEQRDLYNVWSGAPYYRQAYIQTVTGNIFGLLPEEQTITEVYYQRTGYFGFLINGFDGYQGDINLQAFQSKPAKFILPSGINITPQRPYYFGAIGVSQNSLDYQATGQFDATFIARGQNNFTKQVKVIFDIL